MAPATRRFTRHEYERMAEIGILRPDERVELLDGEIVVMSPQGTRHGVVITLLSKVLERAFGRGFHAREQQPLVLGRHSEPEPDVAIVSGRPEDYLRSHPRAAVLVAEVAESSLARDREVKSQIYARFGIEEYWIVDLTSDALEVRRDPARGRYRTLTTLTRRDRVRPLAARRAVAVRSFLLSA